MLGILRVRSDLLVLFHLRVDSRCAFLQARQVAVHLGKCLVKRAPERHKPFQNLVPLLIGLAVLDNGPFLNFLDGMADVTENLLHQSVGGGRDLGNGGHCFGPFRGRRRYLAAFLVVFLDARNLAHELALQHRIIMEVALNHRRHTVELSLNPLRDLLFAVGQQYHLVARAQHRRCRHQPACAQAQRAADGAGHGANNPMQRPSRRVEKEQHANVKQQDRQRRVAWPDHPPITSHTYPQG